MRICEQGVFGKTTKLVHFLYMRNYAKLKTTFKEWSTKNGIADQNFLLSVRPLCE